MLPRTNAWWRHQMETFSALLAICAGNSPVSGEFPAQRPVTRSFDVFFDVRLIKRLSKHSRGWWFETLSHPLWRHRNGIHIYRIDSHPKYLKPHKIWVYSRRMCNMVYGLINMDGLEFLIGRKTLHRHCIKLWNDSPSIDNVPIINRIQDPFFVYAWARS